jgi:hypothetical protein
MSPGQPTLLSQKVHGRRSAPEPGAGTIIVNLGVLIAHDAFRPALEQYRAANNAFGAGMGQYGARQSGVIIELDRRDVAQVYAFGGFSGTQVEIATAMLGHPLSNEELVLSTETAPTPASRFRSSTSATRALRWSSIAKSAAFVLPLRAAPSIAPSICRGRADLPMPKA